MMDELIAMFMKKTRKEKREFLDHVEKDAHDCDFSLLLLTSKELSVYDPIGNPQLVEKLRDVALDRACRMQYIFAGIE